MSEVKPGIYPHVSAEEYARWDAIRHSILSNVARSPMHALHAMRHPKPQTPAMELGQATHYAILEPERYGAEVVRGLERERRSKADRAAWAELEAEHRGKIILRPSDYDAIDELVRAVWAHPLAANLLGGKGRNEVGVLWEDAETGRACKARLDRITSYAGWTCVLDLKTTPDARPGPFAAACARFYYYSQAAYYLEGLSTLDERPRRFLWIAVEKDPPHGVTVYEPSWAALEQGRLDFRDWLRAYDEAERTGHWWGYSGEIREIEMPGWLYRQREEPL